MDGMDGTKRVRDVHGKYVEMANSAANTLLMITGIIIVGHVLEPLASSLASVSLPVLSPRTWNQLRRWWR